jgi:hypothetical protein
MEHPVAWPVKGARGILAPVLGGRQSWQVVYGRVAGFRVGSPSWVVQGGIMGSLGQASLAQCRSEG